MSNIYIYKCNNCITKPVLRESGYDSTGTSALICPVCDTFYTIQGEEKSKAENRLAEDAERKRKQQIKETEEDFDNYDYYGGYYPF